MNPVAAQIDLLQRLLPDAETVGLLLHRWQTPESNRHGRRRAGEARACGRQYTVSSSNEVQQVAESMVGKVDAIYTPTDNTIASAMSTIAMIASNEPNHHRL